MFVRKATFVEDDSSSIAELLYRDRDQTLKVTFRRGFRSYVYHDVPVSVYTEALEADSVGRYVATKVVGHYRFTKLS